MSQFNILSNKIRLRQLRCFVTVARKKSFVLAAEEIGLTQPAVSRSVRELEQLFGFDLFDRSRRGAELTDRGRIFFDDAESGLLQIWRGAESIAGNLGASDSVCLGALPNVCSRFLPEIIREYKLEFPHAVVRIIPGSNVDLLEKLKRGETDFVIGRLSTSKDMKGLTFEALYDEPISFVVRSGHPLVSDNGTATLQDVLNYPMLLPPLGTIIQQEIVRFMARHGINQVTDFIETTSSDFQRAYISTTDAVAALPRGVVQRDLEQGGMVDLGIGVNEMVGPVGLTVNPDFRYG